jgi:protoheme IX farnesyltransferase
LSLPNTDTNPIAADSSDSAFSLRERIHGYYELTKPRLSFLSVVTAVIGYLAADPTRDWVVLASLLIGTSLLRNIAFSAGL